MKTPQFTVTKIDWLTLFKEIIAVYTETSKNPSKQNAEFPILKQMVTIRL
jgi:hypothetical protein